ncbi:MAG: TAXI family TRAP transporter solute-binding subunit [Actinomycetota bacterium]|nr:TAXI family TRAP transporter solute-binding subunit [Actinomycetota bacterium]
MIDGVSRRVVLTGALAPVLAGLAGCSGDDWRTVSTTDLTVASGNPGGVFARYGDALATVLGRELVGVTAETRLTDASVENLRLVADGAADIGLSLGDAASDAVRGTGEFTARLDVVALTRTYDSFVHLVVRGDSPIRRVRDLRGQRVGMGAVGSGTRVVAERILRLSGLRGGQVQISERALQEDADALAGGDLDAFFFVSGLPNDAVHQLGRRTPIRLIPLQDLVEAMVRHHGPEYVSGPIPASTYGLTASAGTVSIKNYVVVHASMDEELAYAVTRVVFEAQDAIDALAPGVRQPNIAAAIFTSPLELHQGAVRYFRERRG